MATGTAAVPKIPLALQPINPNASLRDQAYAALKQAIVEADIYSHKGEVRLDERQLSLSLGVSRTPQLFAFIYPGTCARPGPQPAFAMNSPLTSFAEIGGWRLVRTAAAPLDTLRDGNHSIVVRTSPQDRNIDLFCGDIR